MLELEPVFSCSYEKSKRLPTENRNRKTATPLITHNALCREPRYGTMICK
jgi:hypothetical protein